MSDKASFKGILILILAVAVVGAALWLRPGEEPQAVPPELMGVLRPQPKALAPFSLVDQHGQPFGLDGLKGKTSLLFFGFSHCPEICPTTLTTLAAVKRELAKTPGAIDDLQVILVTVDPERDTPEVLAEYIRNFDPAFIALTGDKPEIDSLGKQFGAGYVREEGEAAGEYVFSHTSSIFLVDPEARLIAAFPPPHEAATIAEQFRLIQRLR